MSIHLSALVDWVWTAVLAFPGVRGLHLLLPGPLGLWCSCGVTDQHMGERPCLSHCKVVSFSHPPYTTGRRLSPSNLSFQLGSRGDGLLSSSPRSWNHGSHHSLRPWHFCFSRGRAKALPWACWPWRTLSPDQKPPALCPERSSAPLGEDVVRESSVRLLRALGKGRLRARRLVSRLQDPLASLL